MKVLVSILNFNLPDYTDAVYEMLNPYRGGLYDIMVMDNGSAEGGKSQYTTHETGKNCYFGGGLNLAFQEMLNGNYDYLLHLNNDIILNGPKFVDALVRVGEAGFSMVSPCIIHPEQEQNYWPVMHNWGQRNPRPVKWIDFTAPLIHRRVIEKIEYIDDKLQLGYGNDHYCAMTCEDFCWKIAVCDFIPIVHLNYMTLKLGKGDMDGGEFHTTADKNQYEYFTEMGEYGRLMERRDYARNYKL